MPVRGLRLWELLGALPYSPACLLQDFFDAEPLVIVCSDAAGVAIVMVVRNAEAGTAPKMIITHATVLVRRH